MSGDMRPQGQSNTAGRGAGQPEGWKLVTDDDGKQWIEFTGSFVVGPNGREPGGTLMIGIPPAMIGSPGEPMPGPAIGLMPQWPNPYLPPTLSERAAERERRDRMQRKLTPRDEMLRQLMDRELGVTVQRWLPGDPPQRRPPPPKPEKGRFQNLDWDEG